MVKRELKDKPLRIAMIAPPWLAIPPFGYGGIENVLDVLLPALNQLNIEVELFTIKKTKLKCAKQHYLYNDEQYRYIHQPIYESLPILLAHTMFALNHIRQSGNFDIIHDHNGFIGPFLASLKDNTLPPILHTLHGPPFSINDINETIKVSSVPSNLPMWQELAKSKPTNLGLVCISELMHRKAPKNLRPFLLEPIHNGVNPNNFLYSNQKEDYFLTLARSNPDKGQAIAVKICRELKYNLKLAGLVCDMTKPKQVMLELANPLSKYRVMPDFRYFSDQIFPYLNSKIKYIGDVGGVKKLSILSKAKALLFPIQWDEPFGMAPIEALACGTPVIAMAKGALPEIIEHGVNGFLAKNESEFKKYMTLINTIKPSDCRKSVEKKFSAETMANKYLTSYKTLLSRQTS